MKQHTMVAMMATNRRMEEAMPAKVVGLRGEKTLVTKHSFCYFNILYIQYILIIQLHAHYNYDSLEV